MAGDYVDGDTIFDTQFLALKRAIEGNAILTGLGGTPGPGALQTTWAAGNYYANFTKKILGGTSQFAHSAGDITYDRWDLIYGNPSGLSKIEGTAAATPQMPDLPANSIIIGLVYIPSGIVTITAGMIRDFFFNSTLLEHGSRHQNGGGDEIDLTGLSGLLADDQNPTNHAPNHEDSGGDEIDLTGLSGLLASPQRAMVNASDTVRNSNDTQHNQLNISAIFILEKETQIDEHINEARIRYKFANDFNISGFGYLAINGTQVGPTININWGGGTFNEYTYDYGPLNINDLVQIWMRVNAWGGGHGGGEILSTKDLRLGYDIIVDRVTTNQDP